MPDPNYWTDDRVILVWLMMVIGALLGTWLDKSQRRKVIRARGMHLQPAGEVAPPPDADTPSTPPAPGP